MSVIGLQLESSWLVLTRHRDFIFTFEFKDNAGNPVAYPQAGDLMLEFYTGKDTPVFPLPFQILQDKNNPTIARLVIQSEDVAKIPARAKWQLYWLPDSDPVGGDPIAYGYVKLQG